ncbi:hypothetical protein B0A48_00622 [Cryoendolithus antarcticus]|uniref:NAD(P)-binding protein n=1 Tax=Cryoendolithus antarcticus TaxID=1507870 RepID=A0A1V8TV61_9PEZI|nr:hypothetical protein B0A48_00622 [Cryoendolithus antarcticus]
MTSLPPFDVSLGLSNTHVLITGGLGLIGRVVVSAFLAAGSNVTIIDLATSSPFAADTPKLLVLHGSISDGPVLDTLFTQAEEKYGPVHCCVALASLDLSVLPQTESLADADPEVWRRVFDINLNGTFLTAQRWLRGIRSLPATPAPRNISLILIGSEAGSFGVRTMPAYAAAKSAVQVGLLKSLAGDVPRVLKGARVNCVAPGAVNTARLAEESREYGEEWRWREVEAT